METEVFQDHYLVFQEALVHFYLVWNFFVWVVFLLVGFHMATNDDQLGVSTEDIFEGRKLIGFCTQVWVAGVDQLCFEVENFLGSCVRLIPFQNLFDIGLNIRQHLPLVVLEEVRFQINHINTLLLISRGQGTSEDRF